jgi:transcriptional regulator with XRE-family HTH domain
MQLGRRIKELRKKRNITQQDLAEMLGVSYQAISRWENNITSPDITALPVLANIFNVTVDYLLDVNINENTQIIENIYKQSWELCVNQKHKEAQELLEEKTKLFPNNYFLKNELLNIYYVLMYDNDKEIYQDKIIDLANEIINNCLISDYKFSAIKALILIYGSKKEFTKGKELLELLPDISYSKDHLKEYTLTGDEKEIAIQEQTDNILSSFEHIIYKTMFKKPVGERSRYLQKYIQLLDLIYEKYLGSPLTTEEAVLVKAIDNALLYYDLKELLNEVSEGEKPELHIELNYELIPFDLVEQEYLELFYKYFGGEL